MARRADIDALLVGSAGEAREVQAHGLGGAASGAHACFNVSPRGNEHHHMSIHSMIILWGRKEEPVEAVLNELLLSTDVRSDQETVPASYPSDRKRSPGGALPAKLGAKCTDERFVEIRGVYKAGHRGQPLTAGQFPSTKSRLDGSPSP